MPPQRPPGGASCTCRSPDVLLGEAALSQAPTSAHGWGLSPPPPLECPHPHPHSCLFGTQKLWQHPPPLLPQALRLPVCMVCFRSCSPALGEGLTPVPAAPLSLLLSVPCALALGTGPPALPFRMLFVPIPSWEVPSVICAMNGESLCLSSQTSRNPASPHPHPASAFSLPLVWAGLRACGLCSFPKERVLLCGVQGCSHRCRQIFSLVSQSPKPPLPTPHPQVFQLLSFLCLGISPTASPQPSRQLAAFPSFEEGQQ